MHEFAGDHRSWEPQVRYFSRRYRCIAFNARGWSPSEVPQDVVRYSRARACDDIRSVLDGLKIDKAHIVGLSMGGLATLHFGLTYPDRARSVLVGGAGYGSEPSEREKFRAEAVVIAAKLETEGMAAFAAEAGCRAHGRQAHFLRRARPSCRCERLRSIPGTAEEDAVVRLLQAPFAGPKTVLAYLARYTHRVAISNRRLIAADATGVTFKVKDYRIEGPGRYRTMMLEVGEFIRRFLMHVLPKGFHRIRHYGLLASSTKAELIAKVRKLLSVPATEPDADQDVATEHVQQCPCCGGRMHIIETFQPDIHPSHCSSAPVGAIRIDTS